MLLLDQLTVPLGVSVPGEMSETVTVQVVGTPTVIGEPQATPVVVDIGLTVTESAGEHAEVGVLAESVTL